MDGAGYGPADAGKTCRRGQSVSRCLPMAPRASPNRKPADPLADHRARGRITEAQYLAGREFQRHFIIADKRRPADLERAQPDGLSGEQLAAWRWLSKCYRQLGLNGSSIVCGMLIDGMSIKQIAEARGMAGEERYFSRRLGECLSSLAVVFGFTVEKLW
jgi:hypothetical protein